MKINILFKNFLHPDIIGFCFAQTEVITGHYNGNRIAKGCYFFYLDRFPRHATHLHQFDMDLIFFKLNDDPLFARGQF